MQRQKWMAATALLLGVVMLLSSCGQAAAASSSTSSGPVSSASLAQAAAASQPVDEVPQAPRLRRAVAFEEMRYARPDTEALAAQLDELTILLREAPDFEQAQTLYGECTALVEDFQTQYGLATIAALGNTGDVAAQAEMTFFATAGVDVQSHLNAFNKEVAEGAHAAGFEEWMGEYTFGQLQLSLLFSAPAVETRQKQRNALARRYEEMIAELTVEHWGWTYTYHQISEAVTSQLYYQLMGAYSARHGAAYAEVLGELVRLDGDIAQALGFESTADMYYLRHGRDYTPADMQVFMDAVKDQLVPLTPWVLGTRYILPAMQLQPVLDAMPEALGQLDAEMQEAWEAMMDYGLYDFEDSSAKQPGIQFTTGLPAYDAAFVCTRWQEDYDSFNTIAHEFGHFYDVWQNYLAPNTGRLDVNETYSSGMETLLQSQYGSFMEDVALAQRYSLQNTLYGTILWQCMLEEFQLRLYSMDSFDSTTAGLLMAELMQAYGLGGAAVRDAYGAVNYWMGTEVLFTEPFYTASYPTTAMAALQLWAPDEAGQAAARQMYLDFAHADQNQPYLSMLRQANFAPPHSPALVAEVAGLYREAFGTPPAAAA